MNVGSKDLFNAIRQTTGLEVKHSVSAQVSRSPFWNVCLCEVVVVGSTNPKRIFDLQKANSEFGGVVVKI